jgi:DNA-binding response OmpR family regulator
MTLPQIMISRFEKWSNDTRPSVDKRRVLVVDDYADIAESLVAVLQIKNFAARGALNGEQALRLFQLWQPNVVILDISLPDIHGVEIGRRMRALARHDAALIAHTALDASEIREEAIAVGFDAFVGKPVSPADLASAINSVCPDAREWAAQRRRSSAAAPLLFERPPR